MYRSWLKLAVCSCLLILAVSLPAFGQSSFDRVKTWGNPSAVYGRVDTATRKEVIVTTSSDSKSVPVNEVESLMFADEPTEMHDARVAAAKGDYAAALDQLSKVKADDIDRDLVKQELTYLNAYYAARLVTFGLEDVDSAADAAKQAKEAGEALISFLKVHPNTFHYYEANEAIGDLLVSLGIYSSAPKYYAALREAPWPEYVARADLLSGRALQLEGKHDEALAAFDKVMKSEATGALADQEKKMAAIYRTYSLAATDKAADAVKILTGIITAADEDDVESLARAYDALGNCYRKLNDSQQALWAYLHVDLKYNSVPDAHAEALANLIPLWTQMHRPDRAVEARDALANRYPFSRWNK